MSSKTFFGTPTKFCEMCGVIGIKDSPIIIIYYFSFVNKRRNKKDNDSGGGDRVLSWSGPGAPTLPIIAKTRQNRQSIYFSDKL